VDATGAGLLKIAGSNETRLLVVLMVVAAGLSAFMNNTTVTAMLVGPVIGSASRSTNKPVAQCSCRWRYASILGVDVHFDRNVHERRG
jgi:Na+/H+ antiporter NhaD/arsenite permease-like protein